MQKVCATTFLLIVLSSLALLATAGHRHAITNDRAHQPHAESRSLSNIFLNDAEFCGKWKRLGFPIEGSSPFEYSGSSISTSADGRIIAVGAPYNSDVDVHAGSVRIFKLWNDMWKPFGDVLSGKSKNDLFGSSIAVSSNGRIIAIGSTGFNNDLMKIGRVKVFSYDFTSKSWIKMGNVITGTSEGQGLGSSIAISSDGQTIAATSAGSGSMTATTLYKYNSIHEKWKQHGDTLLEEEPNYVGGGVSVSLSDDGNIVAIGSKQNSKRGKSSGSVRIFEHDYISEKYEQMGSTLFGENEGDNFGSSISLAGDGKVIAIGSDGYGNNTGCTMIYRYRQKNFDWKMVGNRILGEAKKAYAGTSVSISSGGDTVAVGSIGMNQFGDSSGHTNLYRFNGFTFQWQKIGNSIFGKERGDLSGSNIQLSEDGNTVIIAAPMSSLGAKYSGLTRAYEFEPIKTCAPTLSPTLDPTKKPALSPTNSPTHFPTRSPTLQPTNNPSNRPTKTPSTEPSFSPSKVSSIAPTFIPSLLPTEKISALPTNWPSTSPSSFPTGSPTVLPTDFPSRRPSISPTFLPSILPSLGHSHTPTIFRSQSPTSLPSNLPTRYPSKLPSNRPSKSSFPTSGPSAQPTLHHSSHPTLSNMPSAKPIRQPTSTPSISLRPTLGPSEQPTMYHSSSPSMSNNPSLRPSVSRTPSLNPSLIPTIDPTQVHSMSPSISQAPSMKPTVKASTIPSTVPSLFPTLNPTQLHSISPTLSPSSLPSNKPSQSKTPSIKPSYNPSDPPSTLPSIVPSSKPTTVSSNKPSSLPSPSPSPKPSASPSSNPTPSPSQRPTPSPSVSTFPTVTPTEQPTPTYDGMSALWKFLDRLNGL